MLVKSNSYKQGNILAWDVQNLKKIVKDKDLISFIKEHGQGPFVVMNEYTVHSKDEPVRWLYIRPMSNGDIQDLHMVEESCLTQVIMTIPVE